MRLVTLCEKAPPSAEEVKQAMREYTSEVQTLGCPSAPSRAIVVMEELDKPQLGLDRETDKGYAVSVGRIREDESGIFDVKFVALSHNNKVQKLPTFSIDTNDLLAVIGAAGSSILKLKQQC